MITLIRTKLAGILVVSVTIFLSLLVGSFVYFRFLDTAVPIKFTGSSGVNQSDAANKKLKFSPGETLYAYREFTYMREVTGRVSQRIIRTNSREIIAVYADVYENLPRGDHKLKFPVVLPDSIKPGSYVYDVTITYRLNIFSEPSSITLPPIYFEVL